ncbi:GNAT family N-acetyltransferase [Nocardiopsis changdeensis]|uniref:GNAT family N-acetyltransferase n=1 Tax=Nocardiopsis changdeensis TaxID=2831969 RepID=UPI003F45EFD4
MGEPKAEIRPLDRPGDLGWTIQAHGEVYAREYGWNTDFEALVARIVADYTDQDGPRGAWIAEVDGTRAGCVFCVPDPDAPDTARLRLLLVDPAARGLGLGTLLVRQCLDFARQAGFTRMTLWTNSVLAAARRIYQAHGFTLTAENRHHSFGTDLTGQTWSRPL